MAQAYSDQQLDEMQLSIGAGGMIPGPAGAAFDLTNFGISLDRGHYGWAGVDLLSAIPGLGLPIGAAAAMFGRGRRAAKLDEITRTSANTLGGGVVGGGFERSRRAAYSPFGTIAKSAELDYKPNALRQFAADNNMSFREAERLFENLGISPPRVYDLKVGPQSPETLYGSDIARLPFEERQRELRNLARQERTQSFRSREYLSDRHFPSKLERSLVDEDGRAISITKGYQSGKYGEPIAVPDNETIAEMASEAAVRSVDAIELPVAEYIIRDKAQFDNLVDFAEKPAESVFATSQPRLKNKAKSQTQYTKYADVEVPHIDVTVPEHARYQSAEFIAEDYGFTREGQRYAPGELDEAGNLPFEASMPTMTPGEAAQYESLTSAGREGSRLVDPASARVTSDAIESTDESMQFANLDKEIDEQFETIRELSDDGTDLIDDVDDVTGQFDPGRINDTFDPDSLPSGVTKYVGPAGVNLQGKSLRGYAYDQLNKLDADTMASLNIRNMTLEQFDKLDDGAIVKLLIDANLPIAPGGFVPSIAPDVMLDENVIARAMERIVDPQYEGNIRPLISAKDNMVTAYSELPYRQRMAADELAGLEDPALYKQIESPPGDIVTFRLGDTNETVSLEVFDIYSKGDHFALRLKNTPYSPQPPKSLKQLADKSPELFVSYARSIGVPGITDDIAEKIKRGEHVSTVNKDGSVSKYHPLLDKDRGLIKLTQDHERLSATGKSLKGVRFAWQNTEETLSGAAKNWGGLVKIHHHAAPGDRYPAQLLMALEVTDPISKSTAPLSQVHRLPAYAHLAEPEHQMQLLGQLTTKELEAVAENISQSWSKPRGWQYKPEFNQGSQKVYDIIFGLKTKVPGSPVPNLVPGHAPPALLALIERRRAIHEALDSTFDSLVMHEKDSLVRLVLDLPARMSVADQIAQIRNRVLLPNKKAFKLSDRSIDEMAQKLALARKNSDQISPEAIQSGGFYHQRIGHHGGYGASEIHGASVPSGSPMRLEVAEPGSKPGSKVVKVTPGLKITPSKTVAITGHRVKDLDLPSGKIEMPNDSKVDAIKQSLGESIRKEIEAGKTTFISGMDEGVGLWAAEEVLSLKKDFPDIRLVAALAFKGQDEVMSAANQKRYQSILEKADGVIEKGWKPSKKAGEDFDPAYNSRSKLMQSISGSSIVVHDGRKFGRTAQYLKDLPRRLHEERIIKIDPRNIHKPPAGTEDVDLLAGISGGEFDVLDYGPTQVDLPKILADAVIDPLTKSTGASARIGETFGAGLGKKEELEEIRKSLSKQRKRVVKGWNPKWGKSDLE